MAKLGFNMMTRRAVSGKRQGQSRIEVPQFLPFQPALLAKGPNVSRTCQIIHPTSKPVHSTVGKLDHHDPARTCHRQQRTGLLATAVRRPATERNAKPG